MKRRNFLATSAGVAAGASLLSVPVGAAVSSQRKKRLVLLGPGVRGTGFWGKRIDEFVGLSDLNPGCFLLNFRLRYR